MNDKQFKRVYTSEVMTSTWYYDLDVFRNGPIRVEFEYHDGLVEKTTKVKKPKVQKTKVTKKPKVTKPKAKPKPKKVDKNVSKWFDV